MSREQQSKSIISFMPPPKPWPKIVPTPKQLEDFSNPKNYGVWIDGKKVSNEALKNYDPSDFSHVFISRLYGAARANVNYNFQVDMMTNSYFEEDRKRTLNNKSYILFIKISSQVQIAQ
jgi:bla regulator protein blaR1